MQLVTYLSVLFTVVAAPLGVLGAPSSGTGEIESSVTRFQQSELDADRVLLRFDVRADGTAVASVEYRFVLNGTNRTNAFTHLQRDITTNKTVYLDRFERRVTRTVQRATNTTGRPMRVTNATVRAETRQLPRPYGVVVYTFTWHGFAAVENGELSVGHTLAGLYLDKGMQLQISWPDTYRAQTVHDSASEQRDHAAIWSGPTWFDREGPRLVLVQNGFRIDPIPVVLLALSVLFALGGGAFWWRADRDQNENDQPQPSTPSGPSDPAGGQSGEPTTLDADADADVNVDPELMNTEERILWEISQRGGRVKQQELVAALGWSDAKVSRGVSTLRERDTIEGFRIGNENVLSVPTEDEAPKEES